MRNPLRYLAAVLMERAELLRNNVELGSENKRLRQECAATKQALRHVACERDDALCLAVDLRDDVRTLREGFDKAIAMGHEVADSQDGWKRRALTLYVIADPLLRDEAMQAVAGIEEVPEIEEAG